MGENRFIFERFLKHLDFLLFLIWILLRMAFEDETILESPCRVDEKIGLF